MLKVMASSVLNGLSPCKEALLTGLQGRCGDWWVNLNEDQKGQSRAK